MKRPTFLTAWLILVALGNIFSLYSYTLGVSSITKALPGVPFLVFFIYDVLALLELISVVMLWRWKKIGFYLIVAAALVAVVLNVVVLGSIGIVTIASGILGVGILYAAMRPVWQQFT